MINCLNKRIILTVFLLFITIKFSFSQDSNFDFKNKNVLIVYGGYPPHQPKNLQKKLRSGW